MKSLLNDDDYSIMDLRYKLSENSSALAFEEGSKPFKLNTYKFISEIKGVSHQRIRQRVERILWKVKNLLKDIDIHSSEDFVGFSNYESKFN